MSELRNMSAEVAGYISPPPPAPGALARRKKVRWRQLALAGSSILAVAIIMVGIAAPRRRPAPAEVVRGTVSAAPAMVAVGDDAPQALPIPIALKIAGEQLRIVPARVESGKWIAEDVSAALWESGTVMPYRIRLPSLPGEITEAIVTFSTGSEEIFRAGPVTPWPAPGLILLAGGRSVSLAASQLPEPEPEPEPTPTPQILLEPVDAIAAGEMIAVQLRAPGWAREIQRADASCGATTVNVVSDDVVMISVNCTPPFTLTVAGFVLSVSVP